MKRIIFFTLFMMLVIAPQSSNADMAMWLEPATINNQVGNFSMTLHIDVDYSAIMAEYQSTYGSPVAIDDDGMFRLEFAYDKSLLSLSINSVNFYGGEVFVMGPAYGWPSLLTLNFQALDTGSSFLSIQGYYSFGINLLEPPNDILPHFHDAGYYGASTAGKINISEYVNIPEPATMLLLALGILGLAGVRKLLND